MIQNQKSHVLRLCRGVVQLSEQFISRFSWKLKCCTGACGGPSRGKNPSLIFVALAASFFMYVLPLAAQLSTSSEDRCRLSEIQDAGAKGSASNDQTSMKSLQQTEEYGRLVTEEKNDETVKKNRLVEPSAGERFQQALWCKPWPICETLEGQNFVR
jgi:hypothetical protein